MHADDKPLGGKDMAMSKLLSSLSADDPILKHAPSEIASAGISNVKKEMFSHCKKYGLHREMVEPSFREPFILKGYRKPNMTALDCFKSAFVLYCNETINVWTHMLAFLLFLVKFASIFTNELLPCDPFVWPLLSYAFGICGFCLMSTFAHMFNSVSLQGRHTCFFMDYAAISIYSVGAGQAYYFYSRPLELDSSVLHCPISFGLVSLLVSIASTALCCATRIKWHKHKYLIRTCTYALPFAVNAFPYVYRMAFCSSEVDCESSAFPAFCKQALFYLVSAVANISRFPERYIPGVFDCLGHSHHYLHVFTALGAADQFNGIRIDMTSRQPALLNDAVHPTFWNSLFFMIVAVVSNIMVALHFGKISGKVEYKKDE